MHPPAIGERVPHSKSAKVARARRELDVLGVGIDPLTLDELMGGIDTAIRDRSPLRITFVNPNYLVAAARNARLREMINAFDVVLTDGWGVVLAARLLGSRIPTRLANDDIVHPLFQLVARRRASVFFLGSAPGVAADAAARMSNAFPGLQVAGTMHRFVDADAEPPGRYSEAAADTMVAAVNEARPDVLVVGLPTPDQQRFVIENAHRLDVPVVMTGGAWIDHLAERVQYYPPLMVKLRLCWMYRWAREPRRMTRRYTVEIAEFGRRVLAQRRRARG